MTNPILNNKSALSFYGLSWLLIALAQFIVLYYGYDLPWHIALIDGLLFNFLLAAMCFSAGFAFGYFNLSLEKPLYAFINHCIGGVVLVSIWLLLAYLILKGLFLNNDAYIFLLKVSRPQRFFFGFMAYSLVVLVYYLMIYAQDLKQKTRKEIELNALINEAQLETLKAQINPHFIFNALNSISSLTISAPEKAQEMLINLSQFLRYSLRKEKNELVSLAEELENIDLYLGIEMVRFGNRLQFEKKLSPDSLGVLIPNLILQPLFENAIKHGIYGTTQNIQLILLAECKDKNLKITLKNQFDPQYKSPKGTGLGLKNIRRRLKIIYKSSDLLKTKVEENVFLVELRIPIFSQDIKSEK